MPANDREYLAEVTAESLAGWVSFCKRYEIQRAALVEVIGLRLAQLDTDVPLFMRECVADAVDLEERRRSRRRPS